MTGIGSHADGLAPWPTTSSGQHEAVHAAHRPGAGWPLYALFAGFPLWWVLGLGGFIWLILPGAMAIALFVHPRVRAPRGVGLWLLFLVWIVGSATQLDDVPSGYVFTYRFGLYVSAAILLLYVYNAPPIAVPSRRIARSLATLWGVLVICGFIGLLFPSFSSHTPMERVMPGVFLGNDWIHDMVHIELAQGSPPRASAPFTYTNEWGANFALLTPFALLALSRWRRNPTLVWPLLFAASIIPLVLSTNRGAWISLGLGMAYAGLRLVLLRRTRVAFGLLILVGLAGAVMLLGPVRETVSLTLGQRESTETRASIYGQTAEAVLDSPLLGYGAPRPARDPTQPPLGTHGHLWMLLFSHGVPAFILYVGFLILMLIRTSRIAGPVAFWSNVTVLVGIVQLPFYGALPAQLFIVMTAIGLALREGRVTRETALDREPAKGHQARLREPAGQTV